MVSHLSRIKPASLYGLTAPLSWPPIAPVCSHSFCSLWCNPTNRLLSFKLPKHALTSGHFHFSLFCLECSYISISFSFFILSRQFFSLVISEHLMEDSSRPSPGKHKASYSSLLSLIFFQDATHPMEYTYLLLWIKNWGST